MPPAPTYPGMPRWVKLSGIAAALLVLIVLILTASGGQHGPGRQMKSAPPGTEPGGFSRQGE